MDQIIAAVVGALLGAGTAYLLTRNYEKFKLTIENLRFYHSPEMLSAREEAWEFLVNEYPKDPRPFDDFYADKNGKWREKWHSLNQVLSFWHLILVLHEQGEIRPRLACRVFSQQFAHWKRAIEPLHEQTAGKSTDRPEWLEIMEPGRMDWLCRDTTDRRAAGLSGWRRVVSRIAMHRQP